MLLDSMLDQPLGKLALSVSSATDIWATFLWKSFATLCLSLPLMAMQIEALLSFDLAIKCVETTAVNCVNFSHTRD